MCDKKRRKRGQKILFSPNNSTVSHCPSKQKGSAIIELALLILFFGERMSLKLIIECVLLILNVNCRFDHKTIYYQSLWIADCKIQNLILKVEPRKTQLASVSIISTLRSCVRI